MGSIQRIFLMAALIAFVSGCSGYRYSTPPKTSPDLASAATTNAVAKGSTVRIVLLSGEIVEGEVAWIMETGVAIKQLDEIVVKERVIEAQEIARIEIAEKADSDLYVLGVLVGAGIVYAIVEGSRNMSVGLGD